jgi:hypothetical protein
MPRNGASAAIEQDAPFHSPPAEGLACGLRRLRERRSASRGSRATPPCKRRASPTAVLESCGPIATAVASGRLVSTEGDHAVPAECVIVLRGTRSRGAGHRDDSFSSRAARSALSRWRQGDGRVVSIQAGRRRVARSPSPDLDCSGPAIQTDPPGVGCVPAGAAALLRCRVGGRRPETVRREPTGPGLPPAAASNRACGCRDRNQARAPRGDHAPTGHVS